VDCAASFHGGNIFIYAPSLSAVVCQKRFEGVVFAALEPKFYGEWAGNNSLETLVTWMGQSLEVYVSVTAGIMGECGTSDKPCKFLSFRLN
jgi:hypothetical protein